MVKLAACQHLDCYIVHPLWIETTYFTWKRAAESKYCYTVLDATPKFSDTISLPLVCQDHKLYQTATTSLKVPVAHAQQAAAYRINATGTKPPLGARKSGTMKPFNNNLMKERQLPKPACFCTWEAINSQGSACPVHS